ncbi:MAG: hypothetical protein LBQ61_01715, partial [Spirochaetales bacterium]|nr:hypothetical protein [Spirochaetales bacterium]
YGNYTIPRGAESDIFQSFDVRTGIMLTVKPIDGLSVYALVNAVPAYENANTGAPPTSWAGPNYGASKAFGYVWENIQAAIAYAIPNIGLARLQYVGAHANGTTFNPTTFAATINAPHIGAAFAWTGLEGLTVDVGGKIYLPVNEETSDNPWADPSRTKLQVGGFNATFQKPFMAALGVQYKTGPLTATFRFDAQFAGSVDIDAPGSDPVNLGIEMRPWITLGCAINDTWTVQAEGGVVWTAESTVGGNPVLSSALRYGFGAGLQTTFAPSCYIRTGIAYAGGQAPGGIPAGKTDPEPTKRNGQFSVPVIFSVSF